jgi:hypothetical protein
VRAQGAPEYRFSRSCTRAHTHARGVSGDDDNAKHKNDYEHFMSDVSQKRRGSKHMCTASRCAL